MRWDLFCRVVDNFGDVGVCWRLAADLASRGEGVRLWLDDASALAWMAPLGAAGVEVRRWDAADGSVAPHDVVIEAFGCDLPPAFVESMARSRPRPVWINLEYLSAEAYVERSHGLPSPQLSGPGQGLTKWFFYPGFTPATGRLIREPGLRAAMASFDRIAWLAACGIAPRPGERVVSMFCYAGAPVHALFDALAAPGQPPALVLLTPGQAQAAAAACALPPGLRTLALPWLDHAGFDRLLWSCDLNLVRGEDSLVRALWAGRPFLWQLYPQHDGAHRAKLEAFLQCVGADAVAGLATAMRVWNGFEPGPLRWPPFEPWQQACGTVSAGLAAQPDLSTQLQAFVHDRRA